MTTIHQNAKHVILDMDIATLTKHVSNILTIVTIVIIQTVESVIIVLMDTLHQVMGKNVSKEYLDVISILTMERVLNANVDMNWKMVSV